MCEIIGIITKTKRNILPEMVSALSRLEYRGYDSAGIVFPYDNKLSTHKCLGAPSLNLHAKDIYEGIKNESPMLSIGIGHNRWATHGKPSIKNAHPHVDMCNTVAVVHNGTILNYNFLKKELEGSNIIFSSETDTEVIPQMIAFYIRNGDTMRKAFKKTINNYFFNASLAFLIARRFFVL